MITIRPLTGMQECCVINGSLKSRQHAKMDIFRSFRELLCVKATFPQIVKSVESQKICEKSILFVCANVKFELNNEEII